MTDTSTLPPRHEAPDAPAFALPLRFVWQSDDLGRVTGVSPELVTAMGAGRSLEGRTWDDMISEGFDTTGGLAQAISRRDTWSSVTIDWPLEDDFIMILELAGLPVFDRERGFLGFRGFGVVREAPARRLPADEAPEPASEPPTEPPVLASADTATPVLPFRRARPNLNENEDLAFREIARALTARTANDATRDAEPALLPEHAEDGAFDILETLPAPILIHRLGVPVFANHAFLDLAGFEELGDLILHGLDRLFEELPRHAGSPRGIGLRTRSGHRLRVEAQLRTIRWHGEPASLMFLGSAATLPDGTDSPRERELRAILDTAADGIVMFDGTGRILSVNRGAENLFGYEAAELAGRSFTLLLAADSHRSALEYLETLKAGQTDGKNHGREMTGVMRRGGALPLFLTLGRVGERGDAKFCAVVRDIARTKEIEAELRAAKLDAENASAQKSDFLARISHEVRTPLSAILGFTEVMLDEKYGPLGAERYREYLGDIHASGSHIISLVNDLLDLAKIEAGGLDLNFARVSLNEAVTLTVGLLQPEANANRIIIRTSLTPAMPPVIGDLRSLKQIVLNLVSNAVKYTPAGGQVIVSTVLSDLGQAVVRVRDTGLGMTESEIATAMEPFRQLTPGNPRGGTGLGLPLTKALVEANQALFNIQSAPGNGTLVEVIFPPARVLGR